LARSEAEQVGGHPHLAVAVGPGADADHRQAQLPLQLSGQLLGQVFEHQGKTASALQGMGLARELFLAGRVGALAPIAQAMHRLGGEADVAHHRDAAAHQSIDHGEGFRLGPLQLHRRRRCFLQYPPGGGHGVIGAALVAQEGQVADQQRLPLQGGHGRQPPAHGTTVVEHLVEGHRQGGGVAEHHHGQGVAHQHHLSARLGHHRRREGVPGGEHGKRQSRLLALGQIRRAQGHRPPTAKAIASIQ